MRVAILAIPGVQMLDLAGPMDVFAEANLLIGDPNAYQVQIVGLTLEPITALNGTRFLPDASIDGQFDDFDTLLVAGSPGIRQFEQDARLLRWLTDQTGHIRRLGSVCTGAFLLAHAGLLDGRKATTHWNSTTRLAETFPKIKVEPNRIFVKDGSVYTSAGVTASMDLALALVEEDYGRGLAIRVAKELILFLKRPGGQAQFSMQLAAQATDSGPVRDTHEWVLANLTADLSVETLARRVGMSARNFARLFKRVSNTTPGDYVEAARVAAAQRLLENADLPLKNVAHVCGFRDQGGLRRAFVRAIKVTPAEYRMRFRPEEPVARRLLRTPLSPRSRSSEARLA